MRKILVVDDEYLMCYVLTAIFHDEETEVTSALSGKAALKAINESHLDLCFLDIHLPDMSGLELMKEIRNSSPNAKIIVMTSGEVTGVMMKSIRENAHSLISKFFDLDQVRQFSDRVIKMGKPRHPGDYFAIKDYSSFVKWTADDNRKQERQRVYECITCCFVASSNIDRSSVLFTSNILNASEAGIGILTDYKLQPGDLVSLSNAPARSIGVVRWHACAGTTKSYRAGIQFVEAENAPTPGISSLP